MLAMESTPGLGDLCNNNTRHLPSSALHDSYAAVLHGKNELKYEKSPDLGELQAGSVRIHIKAVGICGSDVHMLKAVSSESTSTRLCLALQSTTCQLFILSSRLRSDFGTSPDH